MIATKPTGAALADARTREEILAALDQYQVEMSASRPKDPVPIPNPSAITTTALPAPKPTENPLAFGRDMATRRLVFSDSMESWQATKNNECKDFACTDLGNSQRFVARFGRDVRYCHPFKSWYIFDGQRWARDDKAVVLEYAKDCIVRIADEAPLVDFGTEQAAAFKWAAASQASSRIAGTVNLAKSAVAISPNDLDKDPIQLNFPNGTLNLNTFELVPHSRFDFITKVTGCNYDPAATCPQWDGFLSSITGGNADLIRYLQRAAGYSLTGNTGERAIFLCYGRGANGKSTFLNTLGAILGEYSTTVDSSTFCVSRGESVRNDIAALKGARLVTATEAGKGKRLDEEIIKKLTGSDDLIKARFLFQEYFEFKPSCKIWWAFNSAPRISDSTDSIWARVRLIPFSVVIPEAQRDIHLPKKLLKESAGIMQWALRGLQEYQKIGLAEPKEIKGATQEYREDQDTLADFFNDVCIIDHDPTHKISCGATDLYQAYMKWHNTEAPEENLKSPRAFGFEMNDHGFKRDRDWATKRKIYLGIRVKTGGF
ncbi:MAG: hypothetical protein GYA23_01890 [Methanomicrobiales archaeon]|nr:hypothetical protein [Methanomicrobiales archaeon]